MACHQFKLYQGKENFKKLHRFSLVHYFVPATIISNRLKEFIEHQVSGRQKNTTVWFVCALQRERPKWKLLLISYSFSNQSDLELSNQRRQDIKLTIASRNVIFVLIEMGGKTKATRVLLSKAIHSQ